VRGGFNPNVVFPDIPRAAAPARPRCGHRCLHYRRGPLQFEGIGDPFGEEEAAREEKDGEDEEDGNEDDEDDGYEEDEEEDAFKDAENLVEVDAPA
jgi:hypothetical protein